MKKLLFTVVLALAAFAVTAQTVTQESILGKWQLIYTESAGVGVDYENRTYTISEETKVRLSADELEKMETGIKGLLAGESLKGLGGMEFTQDMMIQKGKEDVVGNKYIFKAGTPAKIEIMLPYDTGFTAELTFKNGNLVILFPKGPMTFIYKKLNN